MSSSNGNGNSKYIDQTIQSDTKYLDTARSREYLHNVSTAFLKGAAVGGTAFTGANLFWNRRYAAYRALPLPAKAFLGIIFVVPCGVVFSEKAGEHYIADHQWDKTELELEAAQRRAKWDALSTTEKIKDWSSRNQYSIIGGSWVASLGIAFGIVARNKYQTFSQKLVQARMYAQGLTVAVLIASAVLAGVNAQGKKPELVNTDHSWRQMLEHGGSLTPAERVKLRMGTPSESA